ncbi:MAG TPA: NUDIX hydrolase [Candidatus Saccharimonadia bacterium]|nr:NUDIX hydrolase [Candidatus Saccharimonadia bacterium]
MMSADRPSHTLTDDHGRRITITWIPTDRLEQYRPYFQVYGIVFNAAGQILLIQEHGDWKIPGGTPEPGETAEQTLCRELLEEADVTIKQWVPVGVQQVHYPHNPQTHQGELFYQYRYACLLDEQLPSTPDPDDDVTHPRRWVPAAEVTRYVQWGETGAALFAAAIEVYRARLQG